MIEALRQLGELHGWVVAPVGRLTIPLPGSLGILDYMLRDPVAVAVDRGFYSAALGERLLVAPGGSPLAGILLVGYGDSQLGWAEAMTLTIDALPSALPGEAEHVALLPPAPVRDRIPLGWSAAADRFVPLLKTKMPAVKRWHWLDLLEDIA